MFQFSSTQLLGLNDTLRQMAIAIKLKSGTSGAGMVQVDCCFGKPYGILTTYTNAKKCEQRLQLKSSIP
jgi:hypothetical protein